VWKSSIIVTQNEDISSKQDTYRTQTSLALKTFFITETYKLCYLHISRIVLESILKSTLKRQLPYLVGGSITGAIITYYYGFLFSIIVNSVAWFVISTIVNKYYWNYTGFKDELYLVSKYLTKRQKNKPKNTQEIKNGDYKKTALFT
jgi:hypothetical protein